MFRYNKKEFGLLKTSYGNMDKIIDIAIGMSDGLIVPLALTAGMHAAGMPAPSIVLNGLAIVAAGTLIMGFGGYMAGRNGLQKHIASKQNALKTVDPIQAEQKATRAFLANLDLDSGIQDKAVEDWKKEQDEWATLMQDELFQAQNSSVKKKPVHYGLNIGISYLMGGIVPVFPYFFLANQHAFYLSVSITMILVLVLGAQKSIAIGLPWWKESFRSCLLALLATSGTYAVAYFFFS